MKDSRFLDEMKIRGFEPLSGHKSLLGKRMHEICGAWHKIEQLMTFGGIFPEINLAPSIIDVIILTNFYF